MKQLQLEMLRKMVQIRTTEEQIASDFFNSKIFSFLHLSIGQEGAAVGVGFAAQPDDILFGNHRSHGHYLARGGHYERMIREIYGDSGGCCGGFGGSMHMLDRTVGFVGSTPILGSVAPIGVGLAYSQTKKGKDRVAVVFIGDGAAEEGAFYESINLAGLLKCPLIFAMEDNRYAVNSTHRDRKAPGYDHKTVVEGLGAIYRRVDGQDVEKVYEAFGHVRTQVVADRRPAVLHIDTIRNFGHSGPMKEGDAPYRQGDDAKYREENDCILLLKNKIIAAGAEPGLVDSLEQETIKQTVQQFKDIRGTFEVRK